MCAGVSDYLASQGIFAPFCMTLEVIAWNDKARFDVADLPMTEQEMQRLDGEA